MVHFNFGKYGYGWSISLDNSRGDNMDDKIKKLQKDTKKLEKEESALLKADKKRDKVCEYGEREMKKDKK